MQNRNLILLLLIAVLVFGGAFFFQKVDSGADVLWNISNEGNFLLPLIAISALVDSVNPCAFSILLVSIIFLFGIGKTRENIFTYGAAYIFGIFLVYFLIGLGILQVLHIFNVPHFMSKVGAALLIIFGIINILESLFPNFPIKFKMPQGTHGKMNALLEKVSIPAMIALGVLVGLCEFPCTGGPYLTVLGLLHDSQTYLRGAMYLILYNIIFVLPLFIVLFIASNRDLIDKVEGFQKSNKKSMKLIAGFVMIVLAFVILYI